MILSTLAPTSTGVPVDLDCGFKYTPYIPKKRLSVKKTQKGTFTQELLPRFLHGEEFLEWSIDLTTAPIAKSLFDMYNLDDTFGFTGAYGEDYLIEFSEYTATQKGGFWVVSGKFRILCVTADVCFDINC